MARGQRHHPQAPNAAVRLLRQPAGLAHAQQACHDHLMKLKRGQLVEVTFLDHVMGRQSLVKCKAVGWLDHWTEEKVTLKWWQVGEKALSRENDENFTLIRAAITALRPLSAEE